MEAAEQPKAVQEAVKRAVRDSEERGETRLRTVHEAYERAAGEQQAQIKELKGLFSSFDLDSSGSISVAELGDAMSKLGMPLEQSKLTAMVDELDSDNSGGRPFRDTEPRNPF